MPAEPSLITANTTVTWAKSFTAYPAPTWVLTYTFFASSTFTPVAIAAAADAPDHAMTVAATDTVGWPMGTMRWTATVTDGASIIQVGYGSILVRGGTSHVQKMLDAIHAVMENRATQDVLKYSIGNRTLEKMGAEELIKWESHYKIEYQRELDAEQLAQGLPGSKRINVRFNQNV